MNQRKVIPYFLSDLLAELCTLQQFTVGSNIPTLPHSISFNLTLTNEWGNKWTDTFVIPVGTNRISSDDHTIPTPTPIPTHTPIPIPTATPTPTVTPTPSQSGLKGDCNSDGRITPGDAQTAFELYIKILSGEVTVNPPFTSSTIEWAADYNSDGRVTPGDAQLIFEKYIELLSGKVQKRTNSSHSFNPMSASIVQVDEVQGKSGTIVSVPLRVTEGVNIKSFALDIYYDSSELEYIDIDRTGTTTEDFSSVMGFKLADRVNISGFAGSANAITGNVVFIKVRFKVLSEGSGILVVSPNNFLDDIEGATPVSGGIIISDMTQAPVLRVGSMTGKVGSEILIPINIEDADDIKAFSFDIETDYSKLQFIEIENNETLCKGFSSLARIDKANGGIAIAGFSGSGSAVSGNGIFLYLRFLILGQGDTTITLSNFVDDLENATIYPGSVSFDTNISNWKDY